MATTPQIPGANFLAQNQILDDLLELIELTTPEAEDLRNFLKITSNCNFPQQLAAQLNNPNSNLQRFIRENFHPNQGISTLGAATRLFFNDKSVALNTTANAILRNESSPNVLLKLSQQAQLNAHVHVKDPGFTVQNNQVVFTRTGTYAITLQFRLGMWSGAGTLDSSVAPAWRFSDTPANRSMTVQPFIRVYGSLVGGKPYIDIKMLPLLMAKEQIEGKEVISLACKANFKALTGSDVYGRIERFEVGLDRGNTVAYFSNKPDAIGLVKTTAAGTNDLSNFIDLVEI